MDVGRAIGWSIAGSAVLVAVGVLAWQRQMLVRDQAQVEDLRSTMFDLARLQIENGQLKKVQPTKAELERLHSDIATVERLRLEIADLKARQPNPVVRGTTTLSPGAPIPANAWRNVGTATPAAAVETALWAAAGGDIDALAATLGFEPKTRAALERAISQLPDNLRAQYGSPERMAAFFTVKDVPLGDMQILQQRQTGEAEMEVTVRIRAAEAQSGAKEMTLSLQQTEGEWRLIVPPKPLQNYFDIIGAALRDAANGMARPGKRP